MIITNIKDIDNIIMNYKYRMDFLLKFQKCLKQINNIQYNIGFDINNPKFFFSFISFDNFVFKKYYFNHSQDKLSCIKNNSIQIKWNNDFIKSSGFILNDYILLKLNTNFKIIDKPGYTMTQRII